MSKAGNAVKSWFRDIMPGGGQRDLQSYQDSMDAHFASVAIPNSRFDTTGRLGNSSRTRPLLVNEDDGLRQWPVFAALDLIGQQISMCRPMIVDKNGNEYDQGWLYEPNMNDSHAELLLKAYYYYAYYGNLYLNWDRIGNELTDVNCYYPPHMDIYGAYSNQIVGHQILAYYHQEYGKVDTTNFLHARYFNAGYIYGVGALHPIANQVMLLKYAHKYVERKYRDGINLAGIFHPGIATNDAQKQQIRLQIMQTLRGVDNAYEIFIADPDAKFEVMNVKGPDLLLLEHEQLLAARVATCFHMDQQYLNVIIKGDNDTYANVNDKRQDFYHYALLPPITKIEQAFTRMLPMGLYYKLDIAKLVPVTTTQLETAKAMAEIVKVFAETEGLEGAPYTIEEIRAKTGHN